MIPTKNNTQWRKALTLTERFETKTFSPEKIHGEHSPRALKILDKWRSQTPFDQGDYFSRRLALDGISEHELLHLLNGSNSEADNYSAEVPQWESDLQRAFTASQDALPLSDPPSVNGFLAAIEPIIHQAFRRLHAGAMMLAGQHADVPFCPDELAAIFFTNLEKRLQALLSKTMVLELNVARLDGQLAGNTSEERFQSFIRKLRDANFSLNLLREYPVLARQIMVRVEQWVAFSLEFLSHLVADWSDIKNSFCSAGNGGVLTAAIAGLGDNHRDGRTVLICSFSSGLKLVYKPRCLKLDFHFQQLLRWLNHRGANPEFRILDISSHNDHGWVEFIEAKPCDSPDAVERFYVRQGANLALLYALEASDFHYENVIAAGEHPVLIDLEALFQSVVEQPYENAMDMATHRIGHSVLKVGLLPRRIFEKDDTEGIDISGLGGRGGQLTPDVVLGLEAMGTDEMRFTRARRMMIEQKNQPSLDGATVRVQDYGNAVIAGFSRMYEMLRRNREELLADHSPFSCFRHDPVRVLLRRTEIYGRLLWASLHPDVLRDALDRDRLLDQLWVAVEDSPELERVIQSERDDLLRGDIPLFTAAACSHDLQDSSGRVLKNFFHQSGFDLAGKRLMSLSDDDLSQQIWMIKASLTSLAIAEEHNDKQRPIQQLFSEGAGEERFLEEARRVGRHLHDIAIFGRDDASWLGITLVNEHYWSILPLGPKLYDGVSGIALFLAYLSSVTGEKAHEQLARRAVLALRRELNDAIKTMPVGGFSGLGGIIYALCHLAALWQNEALLDDAERIVCLMQPLIEKDDHLDLIGGAAGCILSLFSLYQLRPWPTVLSIMRQCGDILLKKAQPMQKGIGWLVKAVAPQPLTGFSHGAAGISWALLQLAELTGEDRFREAAVQGIEYERSLFLPEEGNWPDLRHSGDAEKRCGTAWCHGAPGIGLARVKMLQSLDREDIRREVKIALHTARRQGFGTGHCLCHGDLGNLEFILEAGRVLDAPEWKQETFRLAANILESISSDGWLCGTPSHVETPGLMTGLAGIGYQMLRLANPSKVPSVLCLEPPNCLPADSSTRPRAAALH